MLLLTHTPRHRRKPLSSFPQVLPKRCARPRKANTPPKMPRGLSATLSLDEVARITTRVFLVYWITEGGRQGNINITLRGRLDSNAIDDFRAEIRRHNKLPKKQPIVIANLIELERSAA